MLDTRYRIPLEMEYLKIGFWFFFQFMIEFVTSQYRLEEKFNILKGMLIEQLATLYHTNNQCQLKLD